MRKYFIILVISAFFQYSYCEIIDKHYTEEEFQNEMRDKASFVLSDTLKLVTCKSNDKGDFYSNALQGTFLNAIKDKRATVNTQEHDQLKNIEELYKNKSSKQDYETTLNGIKEILSRKEYNYSPCVIAFSLITEIMPNKEKLNAADIEFFVNSYKHTDSKLIQHAIYTSVLNGNNALKHKSTIVKYGNYLDNFYLLISLVRGANGKEQEKWKMQLKELKEKSPRLKDQIDFFLNNEQ